VEQQQQQQQAQWNQSSSASCMDEAEMKSNDSNTTSKYEKCIKRSLNLDTDTVGCTCVSFASTKQLHAAT